MAARNDELRVTLLGLALLGLLLLSHHAASVDAAPGGAAGEDGYTANSAGGRHLNSFSMNSAENGGARGGRAGATGAGGF